MTSTTIHVGDMHCASCSGKIKTALLQQTGIQRILVNPVLRQLFIQHSSELSSAQLMQDIEALGFRPSLDHSGVKQGAQTQWLRRLGIAGICAMQVMMIQIALYAGFFHGMSPAFERLLSFAAMLFCIPIVAYSAVPFFVRGFAWLVQRPCRWTGINMDTPIALAIAIAFTTSVWATLTGSGDVYFDSVGMFTFLMLGARYLDQRFRSHLQVSGELSKQLPLVAHRITKRDQIEDIELDEINTGDLLWVEQGAQIPADGKLVDKQARINTALLTGEADAIQRKAGDVLYAGTFNESAALTMRATHTVDNSRITSIDTLASEAGFAKHGVSRLADGVARIFIPAILGIALLTFVGWTLAGGDALSATLAVLVVSCPCALSLATPAAISGALSAARRKGVLIRNSRAIENSATIKSVYFDKTGTLTLPTPRLVDVVTLNPDQKLTEAERNRALNVAAALQRHSNHPLAQAFRPFDVGLNTNAVEDCPGRGMRGDVEGNETSLGSAELCKVSLLPSQATNTDSALGRKIVYMSGCEGQRYAFILDTPVREDARQTIEILKSMGIEAQMSSGDVTEHCRPLAQDLDLSFASEMSPESKQREVMRQGTLFVGDGLNDLPALASADVSIATMETVDLVKSKADGILMTSRLGALIDLIEISRLAKKITRQNLVWALAYNCIAIPIAMAGLATPWLAALGMSASSLLVMANASRLLRH